MAKKYVEQEVNIGDIKVYDRNPRQHPEKQIEYLMSSIERYGQTTPLLLNKNYEVIAGHGRLEALKRLGKKKAVCWIFKRLSKAEEKSLRLLDNKISDLSYDNLDFVKSELEEIFSLDKDIINITGWDYNSMLGLEENPFSEDDLTIEEEPTIRNSVIHFDIIFNNMDEKNIWIRYINYLNDKYPDGNLSEKLIKDIGDKQK